jgi:hypothetical protein
VDTYSIAFKVDTYSIANCKVWMMASGHKKAKAIIWFWSQAVLTGGAFYLGNLVGGIICYPSSLYDDRHSPKSSFS